jgi:hypothetical protein
MDGPCATQRSTERREPISITLADLLALVVGSALAVSLPQLHWPSDRIAIGNVPVPGWFAWLFVIAEAAMKVCLALIPVILGRRARYGGLHADRRDSRRSANGQNTRMGLDGVDRGRNRGAVSLHRHRHLLVRRPGEWK